MVFINALDFIAKSTSNVISQDLSGHVFQVQYDNPWSVRIKFHFARQLRMRGVSMWQMDGLDFTTSQLGQQMRQDMFDTFDAFIQP